MTATKNSNKARKQRYADYRANGTREANKARRIAKDAARANPLRCGHGSRHAHFRDGMCRRCWSESGAFDKAAAELGISTDGGRV